MKLKKFKERDNKRIGIIVFTLVCILLVSGVILYRTFAIFEVKTNQNVIKGTVQGMGDIEFAFYIDDKIVKSIPDTKEDYVFDEESSTCTNGASVYWDYQRWGPNVSNITQTKTKCYLKFKTEYSEPILNGAVPKLKEDLVPVTIDADGTVKKANITQEWYNYENQQWANAVITGNSYELLGNNVHSATKGDGYVHFDGQDDYIDLGLANYDFGNQITMAIKLRFNDVDSSQEFFGNWETAGGGLHIQNKIVDGGGFWIGDTYSKAILSDEEIQLAQDYTFVVTYDGSKIVMYINGKKQSTEVIVSGNMKISAAPIFIGAAPNLDIDPAHFSNINVYQAAIFNRAIDEEEIQDISNNFKITNGASLLRYVDFTNKEYEAGEVISENNIESYFVWIPRYKYQIWNGEEETSQFNSVEDLGTITSVTNNPKLTQAKEIKIEFENKHMPVSNGNLKNQWLTHPAFTSFDSNGFWVGKFETGYKGATQATDAEQNIQDASKVIIKPNVYSWRGIQVANASYTSQGYKQNLDSHMIKNMEWGAVAYLTNSKYGRCSNESCSEVRINNNSNHITGSSAKNAPTCGYIESNDGTNMFCNQYGTTSNIVNNYNNPDSVESSTTNNYYGVFDMSGGSWEYVMGVMLDQNEKPASGRNDNWNSGFIGPFTFLDDASDINKKEWTALDGGVELPSDKYYDKYEYSESDQSYQKGLFGDGTKEFGPFFQMNYSGIIRRVSGWYADYAYFVATYDPWFARGGDFSLGSWVGLAAFLDANGDKNSIFTFRIVLTS